MKFKTVFIFFLFVVWLFQGCKSFSTDTVSIQGTFTNVPRTRLYIFQILPANKALIDTVDTDASGHFSISFPVKKAGIYSLFRNPDNEITLVVSPGENILITGNGNSLRNTYTVEGSK